MVIACNNCWNQLIFAIFFLSFSNDYYSQNKIKGVVLNSNNDPVENVLIRINTSNISSYTNSSGEFSLEGLRINDTISFLHLSYLDENVAAKDIFNKDASIVLKSAYQNLDEILINPFMTQRRKFNNREPSRLSYKMRPGIIIAYLIESEPNSELLELTYFLEKSEKKARKSNQNMNLNFWVLPHNAMAVKSKSLYDTSLNISPNAKRIKIDFSSIKLKIPDSGVFVALELNEDKMRSDPVFIPSLRMSVRDEIPKTYHSNWDNIWHQYDLDGLDTVIGANRHKIENLSISYKIMVPR